MKAAVDHGTAPMGRQTEVKQIENASAGQKTGTDGDYY